MSAQRLERRPPVMKDVAKAAGLSHQTVSRVLNGHPNVSADARRRVEEAISYLGYRRNTAARSLVTRRSQTIGVLAAGLAQYGPAQTLLGIERAARDAGYFVSIAALTEITSGTVADAVSHFSDQSVDGIVIVVPDPAILRALDTIDHAFPAVTASAADKHLGSAVVNQRLGARLAVEHLVGLGHRSIGHLSGPLDWYDAVERVEGWKSALKEAGLTADYLVQGDWSAQSGYAAGREFASTRPASGMIVGNDQMALGFLRALQDSGLHVPADVSIVGYDDQPEAAYLFPALTTVRQDFEELGRRCIELLLGRTDATPDSPHIVVDPQLIVRSSTATFGPME
ncbi:LacI family DNA-binding transcriptional regulator [bacterium RCC_150]